MRDYEVLRTRPFYQMETLDPWNGFRLTNRRFPAISGRTMFSHVVDLRVIASLQEQFHIFSKNYAIVDPEVLDIWKRFKAKFAKNRRKEIFVIGCKI